MANTKTGFNYWSCETDRYQDIKIKRLKKDFKCEGVCIHDYILNEIYRVKGCYMDWDDSVRFDVAEYWGIKEDRVQSIIEYCCLIGLFDPHIFTTQNKLTSKAIQVRFLNWSVIAKRKQVKVPEELNIIPEVSRVSHSISDNLPEKSPEIQAFCREVEVSKVEESNITKSKVEEVQNSTAPALSDFFNFFKNKTKWDEAYCNVKAEKIFNHYDWEQTANWEAVAASWAESEIVTKTSPKKPKGGPPDYWSADYASKLDGPGWSNYISHLHSIGLKPIKYNGKIIDFRKAS